jgi:hypothetical protein
MPVSENTVAANNVNRLAVWFKVWFNFLSTFFKFQTIHRPEF